MNIWGELQAGIRTSKGTQYSTPMIDKNAMSIARDTVRTRHSRQEKIVLNNILSELQNLRNPEKIDKVRSFYLVDTLLTAFIDDALTPDITTGDILEIRSDNKQINDALKVFQDQFDLDDLTTIFAEPLLLYGEAFLKLTVTPTKGVTKIVSKGYLPKLVAIYHESLPCNFIEYGERDITLHSATDFIHFTINPTNRVINSEYFKVNNQEVKLGKIDESSTIRVGRSIFYGSLSKIEELATLEALIPALKLSDIEKNGFVGIDIPASTTPKDAFEICRTYEDILNNKLGLDRDRDKMSVTDIINATGRIKVIPNFSGKGSASNLDLRQDNTISDMLSSVDNYRQIITSSIGYPNELLYGEGSKSEIIKKYARYLRKVKSIQAGICRGFVQLAITHLNNLQGMPYVSPKDIIVEFRNETINVDELEKLEFQDALVSMTKQIAEFVQSLPPVVGNDNVDWDSFSEWLRTKLSYVCEDKYNFIKPKDERKAFKPKQPDPNEF